MQHVQRTEGNEKLLAALNNHRFKMYRRCFKICGEIRSTIHRVRVVSGAWKYEFVETFWTLYHAAGRSQTVTVTSLSYLGYLIWAAMKKGGMGRQTRCEEQQVQTVTEAAAAPEFKSIKENNKYSGKALYKWVHSKKRVVI